MRWTIGVALAASCCLPAFAAPSEADWAAVRQASSRGRLIYAYDRAAWHGTDDLTAKLPDAGSIVGGWVVDGPADAPTLVFFDRARPTPRVVYVAQFKEGRLVASRVLGAADDRSLSPARLALIAAREKALNAIGRTRLRRCSERPLNTVVLPPERSGAPTLVYVLESQPDGHTFPIGGNYRLDVAEDGAVSTPVAFAKSCIAMSVPKDKKPQLFFVMHLLGPVPTEIHAFASLAARTPIAVGTTNKIIWIVNADRISAAPEKRAE